MRTREPASIESISQRDARRCAGRSRSRVRHAPGAGPSFGTTPTADAFVTTVRAEPSPNNYGGAGASPLRTRIAQGEFQSVLRFDLAGAVAPSIRRSDRTWTLNRRTPASRRRPRAIRFSTLPAGCSRSGGCRTTRGPRARARPPPPARPGHVHEPPEHVHRRGDEALGTFASTGPRAARSAIPGTITGLHRRCARRGRLTAAFGADGSVSASSTRAASALPRIGRCSRSSRFPTGCAALSGLASALRRVAEEICSVQSSSRRLVRGSKRSGVQMLRYVCRGPRRGFGFVGWPSPQLGRVGFGCTVDWVDVENPGISAIRSRTAASAPSRRPIIARTEVTNAQYASS